MDSPFVFVEYLDNGKMVSAKPRELPGEGGGIGYLMRAFRVIRRNRKAIRPMRRAEVAGGSGGLAAQSAVGSRARNKRIHLLRSRAAKGEQKVSDRVTVEVTCMYNNPGDKRSPRGWRAAGEILENRGNFAS